MIGAALSRIVGLVALAAAGWLISRWVRGAGSPLRGPRRPNAAPPGAEAMIRDRVCNTFLPRSKALVLTPAGQEYGFCSQRCRTRFLAERSTSTVG